MASIWNYKVAAGLQMTTSAWWVVEQRAWLPINNFSAFGSICDMLTFTTLTFNLWPSNNVVSSLVRLPLKGNLVYAWSLCDPMAWTFHSLIIKWHSGYNNYYIEKLVYWIWSFNNFLCLCRKPSTVQKAIETGRLFLRNAWKGLILVSNTVIQ